MIIPANRLLSTHFRTNDAHLGIEGVDVSCFHGFGEQKRFIAGFRSDTELYDQLEYQNNHNDHVRRNPTSGDLLMGEFLSRT